MCLVCNHISYKMFISEWCSRPAASGISSNKLCNLQDTTKYRLVAKCGGAAPETTPLASAGLSCRKLLLGFIGYLNRGFGIPITELNHLSNPFSTIFCSRFFAIFVVHTCASWDERVDVRYFWQKIQLRRFSHEGFDFLRSLSIPLLFIFFESPRIHTLSFFF